MGVFHSDCSCGHTMPGPYGFSSDTLAQGLVGSLLKAASTWNFLPTLADLGDTRCKYALQVNKCLKQSSEERICGLSKACFLLPFILWFGRQVQKWGNLLLQPRLHSFPPV